MSDSPTFRLTHLPKLAILEVWKCLDVEDQFSLSTTSSKFKALGSKVFAPQNFQLALLFVDNFQLGICIKDHNQFFHIQGSERVAHGRIVQLLKYTKPCKRSNFWSALNLLIEFLGELFKNLEVVLQVYTDQRNQENVQLLLETLIKCNLKIGLLNFHAFNVDPEMYEMVLDGAREASDVYINCYVNSQNDFVYMNQRAGGSPTRGEDLVAGVRAMAVSRSPQTSPVPVIPFQARHLTIQQSQFVTTWHLTNIFLNVESLCLNGCNLGSRQIGSFLRKWMEGSAMSYFRISYNGRWVKAIFDMHRDLEAEPVREAIIDGSPRTFHDGECYLIRQVNGTKALVYWDIFFYLNVVY